MCRRNLLPLVAILLAGCALSDEPGPGTKTLPQGLSVLKATDTSVSLAYRKADTVIYLSALIGRATPEPYQVTPGSPRFEVDARFDAQGGRTFYSRRGGDQWLDPSWPADLARQGALPLTRESNAVLFGLAAEATAALEREAVALLGADRVRRLAPAVQALVEFGIQAADVFTRERANLEQYLVDSGATAEEIRQDEVAYGTSGPEDGGPYLMGDGYYYIAVHDKGIYWDFGYHSATRLYQWYGYWAAIHDACNHGDCAGSMGQKCTLDYYASPVGWKPAWFFQSCATGYDWDSEDGGHNCHDDTRLQLNNFVYGSYNNGSQGWCNDGDSDTDISVDIWGIELDQDGSPECNGSMNKGYNHPWWSTGHAWVCTPGSDRLCPGESLGANQYRDSADGRFRFVYQGDGNLVLYRKSDWRALWAASSNSAPGATTMQGDGNLVVYNASWQARWASNTWKSGTPGYWLVVQNDGNVVIYDPVWGAKWSTGTWGY